MNYQPILEDSLAITRRPTTIFSRDDLILSLPGTSLWIRLEERENKLGVLFLDDGLTLLLDAVIETERGAVGDSYELVLCSPVIGIVPSRRLDEVSRIPDASDLRVRGANHLTEFEKRVKAYTQEVKLDNYLIADSVLIEPKESMAIFGRDTRNHHIQLYASLEHIRFSTENVLYEK
ncbi:MAG: hypothetical protein ACOC38_12810, partial [Promethearchaeia archaeon]